MNVAAVTAQAPSTLAAGTKIARLSVPWNLDKFIRVTREVGVRDGYGSFQDALKAAHGVTVGNLPAVGILELEGRFHTFQLDRAQHWLSDVSSEFLGQAPYPAQASHLPLPTWSKGVRAMDERLAAIVDGSETLYLGFD